MTSEKWYSIKNIDSLDTPGLVVYPERIQANIRSVIESVDGDVTRLRPHIKTSKSAEVASMMLQAGITRFKCATIAEAEMLAETGAKDGILAYQPVGPKVNRFITLVKKYPHVKWSCLIDNIDSATVINSAFKNSQLSVNVFIDLNVGMNRSGITPEKALNLFEACLSLTNINIAGLHAYDGHIRDKDFTQRETRCNQAFEPVLQLQQEIQKKYGRKLTIVAGGTPTFSVHCQRKDVECSPGTFVYWDKGYEQLLTEQKYQQAALVVTRIISLPAPDIICVDLGHKSIASENPLPNRVTFLDSSGLEPVGHSEEHMTLKISPGTNYKVGDVLYGVPYHICPTVALHESVAVIQNHFVTDSWTTAARKRKISI